MGCIPSGKKKQKKNSNETEAVPVKSKSVKEAKHITVAKTVIKIDYLATLGKRISTVRI